MRIVDLDSLKNMDDAKCAAAWIAETFTTIPTPQGPRKITTEAIYFFSTSAEKKAVEIAATLGLVHSSVPLSNFWNGPSLAVMLARMLAGINDFRSKHHMSFQETFNMRFPVTVFTNREFEAIERAGALPLPFKVIHSKN